MSLTKEEIKVAADCAENYPEECAFSYFSHIKIVDGLTACKHLKDNPDDVEFG